MEKYSGACLIAYERIFYNMQLFNDKLWDMENNES